MAKTDPNDARYVAVAALRSPARREVRPHDHATVLKVWSKRHRDLGRARTQVVCRLHGTLPVERICPSNGVGSRTGEHRDAIADDFAR
jgi:hypothetical protein